MRRLNQTTTVLIVLSLFLVFSTAAILFTTWRDLRSVRTVADSSLENTGIALALSAENALRAGKGTTYEEIRKILSDRVVAYAFIARRDGTIVYHTNPSLIGSKASDPEGSTGVLPGRVTGRRITLQTGLPAYLLDYPFRVGEGEGELLRIVLNTSTFDRVLSEAEQVWWTVGFVIAAFWVVGLFSGWNLLRSLRMQAELERRSRMAIIGQMTSVLAHEIRNALVGIKGFTQWIDEKTSEDDSRKTGLGMILKGTDRVESLVNDLLQYAREETYDVSDTDMAALVKEEILPQVVGWGGEVVVNARPGALAKADREKLRRAVTNGVRNALQAMGDRGTLGITVEPRRHSVVLTIEDTGPGIPGEAIERIFTPFFTTRADGTGLGLAYSKKVVESMGGSISLANKRNGQGALLTIALPKGGSRYG